MLQCIPFLAVSLQFVYGKYIVLSHGFATICSMRFICGKAKQKKPKSNGCNQFGGALLANDSHIELFLELQICLFSTIIMDPVGVRYYPNISVENTRNQISKSFLPTQIQRGIEQIHQYIRFDAYPSIRKHFHILLFSVSRKSSSESCGLATFCPNKSKMKQKQR